jgi:hypothetical protein
VIISQQVVSDWLILNPEGKLMAELRSANQNNSDPLLSDTIVTNGDWHRVGLVWDGSYRRLYVDGAGWLPTPTPCPAWKALITLYTLV